MPFYMVTNQRGAVYAERMEAKDAREAKKFAERLIASKTRVPSLVSASFTWTYTPDCGAGIPGYVGWTDRPDTPFYYIEKMEG